MRPNYSQPVATTVIRSVLALLACVLALCGAIQAAETEIVVAADGSGKFKTVQEAIMSVPAGTRENPVIIRIKRGTYKELIYVQREKRFFRLVGEDPATTVLTYDLHANLLGNDGRPIGRSAHLRRKLTPAISRPRISRLKTPREQ